MAVTRADAVARLAVVRVGSIARAAEWMLATPHVRAELVEAVRGAVDEDTRGDSLAAILAQVAHEQGERPS